MLRNSLFKSVLTLTVFYWLGTMILFFLQMPDTTIALLEGLPKALRPDDIPEKGTVVFWKANVLHMALLKAWTVPAFYLWATSVITGLLCAYVLSRTRFIQRQMRLKKKGHFRGVTVSVGAMVGPPRLKGGSAKLKLKGLKITPQETNLLRAVLGVLYAHPKAYAGAGHGDKTLYQHTIGVIKKILKHPECNGEMLIVAAAHDIGKITSFKKNDRGEWKKVRLHAQESGRLLATLDEWQKLPLFSRERIRLAVKYEHSPQLLPGIELNNRITDLDPLLMNKQREAFLHPVYDKPGFKKSVQALIQALREADGMQTAEEKKEVLSKIDDLPEFCYRAFIKTLPDVPFYTKESSRGTQAMGWKNGSRFYFSEAKLREHIMARSMSEEHRAALGGSYRGPQTIAPYTWHLLTALKKKGMLVEEGDCYESLEPIKEGEEPRPPVKKQLSEDMPLWDVLSGKNVLSGMIVIDAQSGKHQDFLDKAEKLNVPFKIALTAPHKERKAARKREKELKDLEKRKEDVVMQAAIEKDAEDHKRDLARQAKAAKSNGDAPLDSGALMGIHVEPSKPKKKGSLNLIPEKSRGSDFAEVPQDPKKVSEGDDRQVETTASSDASEPADKDRLSVLAHTKKAPDSPQVETQDAPGIKGEEGAQAEGQPEPPAPIEPPASLNEGGDEKAPSPKPSPDPSRNKGNSSSGGVDIKPKKKKQRPKQPSQTDAVSGLFK